MNNFLLQNGVWCTKKNSRWDCAVGQNIGSIAKKIITPVVKAGFHLAPVIGTVAGAMYGSPEIGGLIGGAVNKVGRKIGIIS